MLRPLLNGAVTFSNIAATPTAFTLRGGLYGVTSKGTWGGGSATLQRLAPDNATYVTVLTAIAADGYATVQLPPGTYRLLITTATAVYVDIIAIATDL
jgi:hypothetical protein